MKIILVGIHNKPGLSPLDSSTKTGQMVDRVIAAFPGVEFVKSNLFDADHIPADAIKNCQQYVREWAVRTSYNDPDDIAIVLGNDAKHVFKLAGVVQPLFKQHPAARQIDPEAYINDVILILRAYLQVKPVLGL